MASQRRVRPHRIRTAALVLLGAVSCDHSVEPPAETPVLAVSARDVSLFVARRSAEPDEVTIQISNNGDGTLSGLRVEGPIYVGAADGWLEATLEDSTLTLTGRAVTTAGDTLDTGSYEARVDVAADAANSPRTITVSLEVGTSQQIALSVGRITFSAQATGPPPPAQTVVISNAGDGVLSELAIDSIVYRPGEPSGWLDTTLIRTRAPTSVVLQPNSVPQSQGTLHTTVFVGSRIADPPTAGIDVEFIVAPPPTLVLSTTTLELEAVEGQTPPMVYEIALRELNQRPLGGLTDPVSTDPSWLTASRDPAEAPATLTITVDPSNLAGDMMYRDTVSVSSSAGVVEEVAVALRVARGPTVHLSMDTVRFVMNPTDALPGAQRVRIVNSGAGSLTGLSITDPQPAAWLSASLSATSAPADLVLNVVSASVTPGTVQTADVEVTDAGGDTEIVTVSLEMLQGPSIVLSSDSVTFRSDSASQGLLLPAPLTVAVANGGTGVLSGLSATVSGGSAWLDAPILTSTTAATTLQLGVLTVPDSGTYLDTVIVASAMPGVNPVPLPVVLEVGQDAEPTATIGLSSESVLFRYVQSEAPPEVVIGIENLSGQSYNNLDVGNKPKWLNDAFVVGDDPPTALRLILNPAQIGGLSPPVNDIVTITGNVPGPNDPEIDLPVRLEVSGPEMVATSDRVVFRAYRGETPPPDSQVVTVSNRAAGTLRDVLATEGESWLDATPSSPLTAPASIVMRPTTTDLPASQDGDVDVFGDADNSPLPIDVRYEIDSGPTLKIASDSVRLSALEGSTEPDSLTVDLFNSGRGALGVIGAAASQPWLTATIDSSATPTRLVLVASADSTLVIGSYVDDVGVTSTLGGSAAVKVTFAVTPQPEIDVSPEALVFHANALSDSLPAAQAVSVFDPAGGPSGQITATADVTWLDVDVDVTTLPVTVVARPNQVLDSGGSPYAATLSIESTVSTGAARQVQVTYNIDVGLDPVIDLSTDLLVFTKPTSAADEIPAQTVEIENAGSRTLRELSVADVTAGGPVDWLFVLLDSRIAPATLTVAILPAEAASTNRNEAILEITGEDAEPRQLIVRLQ